MHSENVRREFITLRRLPLKSMQDGLDKLAAAGFQIDARLYAMALGYSLGSRAPLSQDKSRGEGDRPKSDVQSDGRSISTARAVLLIGVAVVTNAFVKAWVARRSG